MTNYVNPLTGSTINPSQVGYEYLFLSEDTTLQWPINGNNDNVVSNIMDVEASVDGFYLILPSAQQVSVGQNIIIRNIGVGSFVVTDAGENTITDIGSGIAKFIYLTDNSTDDGIWDVVTFGAGTSAANAASLEGFGLTALSTTLNQSYDLSTISSNYTFLSSDRARFIVWNGGVGALTLPPSASVGNNWFVIVRNGGTGILTITPQGVDTIDGNANQQLQLTESLVIVCTGSGYNTFAYGRSNQFAFTTLTKNVTGGTVTLTSVEGANVIQSYIGTLTSNCVVVLPSTVQLYSIQNATSGAFSLSFRTASGSPFALAQGQTVIIVCDGTNVYNANTSTSAGSITTVTLNDGSAGSPTLRFNSDLTTGLYLVGSGQLGFSAGGTNRMTLTTTGLLVPVGVGGGAF
jgi:hypothetical protein